MYTWPSQLPDVQLTFDGQLADGGVARTQMASGRYRQVQRYTSQLNALNVQWTMTSSQFYLFKGWFRWYISNGADYFYLPLPVGIDDNLYNTKCRFVNGFKQKRDHPYWVVSAIVETEDSIEMSKATLDASIAGVLTDSAGTTLTDSSNSTINSSQ